METPSAPDAYMASLPDDRRALLEQVRTLVRERLPEGYEEAFDFGMIVYQIPLTRYPETYNRRPLLYAALASKKNYCTLHLHGPYADPQARQQLEDAFAAAGKKLDMGKACLRFKTLDDLSLDAIGDSLSAIPPDAFVALYEQSRF